MRNLRPFLAALSLAAASLVPASAAHALAPSAFVPSTSPAIAPSVVAALTGGQYEADQISEAQYSPDHSRILFLAAVTNDAAPPQFSVRAGYVAVRADGSQLFPFPQSITSAGESISGGAWSADGAAVTWKVVDAHSETYSGLRQYKLRTSGTTDTWSLVPHDEIGETTGGGKYRIVPPNFSPAASNYRVVDVATGIGYDVLTPDGDGFAWIEERGCGRTGLAPTPANIGAALAGANPACSFPAAPTGDDLSPATVASLSGAVYFASEISEATYSPDHQRILFLQTEQSSPFSQPGPTFVRYRRYVEMRADGSQIHPFAAADATFNDRVVGGSWSSDSTRVGYYYGPGSQDFGGGGSDWSVSIGAGDVDTWSLTPRDSLGTPIAGGRYRLVPPHLNGGDTYRVVDTESGVGYDVLQTYTFSNGRYDWIGDGCGSSGLAPQPSNIEAAVSGNDAACSFARRAFSTPSPTPSDSPTPSPTITPGPKQIFLPEVVATPTPSASPTVTPAPTPTPTKTPVPTLRPQSATVGPVLKVVSFTRSLSLLRSRGFTVKYGPTTAIRLRAWLMIPLGGPLHEVVAQGTLIKPAAAGGTFRITLSPKGRKALRGITSTTLTLRVAGVDAARHATWHDVPASLT